MVLTFVKNKQITFFRLYKVTYNILQRLKKVVNDQCELKNADFCALKIHDEVDWGQHSFGETF